MKQIQTMLSVAVATGLTALALPTAAFAQAGGGGSILIGPGYDTDADRPVGSRLSIRGEIPLATGEAVALGLVVPVTVQSSADAGFGLDIDRTAIEVAPSLRLHAAPLAVVSPYLDAGAGGAFGFSGEEDIFTEDETQQVAFLGRAALGLSFGRQDDPGNVTFILEPIGTQLYVLEGEDNVEFSSMLGVGARF